MKSLHIHRPQKALGPGVIKKKQDVSEMNKIKQAVAENNQKRVLGVLNGSKGYLMRNDFGITSSEEFPI